MKKTILALGAMQTPEMDALKKAYDVIKLWRESDPEATLQAVKLKIQVILSTYNSMPVTRRIIESLPNLELIAVYGAGVNNIDLVAAKDRLVTVLNTPDAPTKDTADVAMALILNTVRRLVEADMFVRVGKWANGEFPDATSLTGKVVGICGMGRIGRAIAKRAAAFDMNIIYHSRTQKPDLPYVYYPELINMAQACDILVVACSADDITKHLINYKILKALGANGYLINVSRGMVVNTDDLLIALSNRDIAGAGLDVYENEPSVPQALISMDNVVLLPHIGGGTVECCNAMGKQVITNIDNYFAGRI